MYCLPNLHLIGVRKSGTTDFSEQWMKNKQNVEFLHQDYWAAANICPIEYFRGSVMERPHVLHGHAYNGGPGTLMTNRKVLFNETHLVIASGMQFLGYMSTPATRFYIQLRNPTDRVISYLFYWQKLKQIPEYKDKPDHTFTPSFVDELLRRLMRELQHCLDTNGEVACVYTPSSEDGNLNTLITHSLYIVFLKEALRFVPQEQILLKTMEEYSLNQKKVASEVILGFFGVDIPASLFKNELPTQVINEGPKKYVWPSTLTLLDEFFAPFNQRLSELLGDRKWMFSKSRT
ncbi:carbohydrate sulfotransferase 15-like [Watersipora subatra]|uniref:carbohydrate sulfotransferase 15-like n=1 Tax=Watersipora subatra TaxID=2589382 RepID=UPI00355C11FF